MGNANNKVIKKGTNKKIGLGTWFASSSAEYKIGVFGDGGVGKSSLIYRFRLGQFPTASVLRSTITDR